MKSWTVIPASAVVSACAVLAVTHDPFAIASAGFVGAALASAVRALAGETRAALVAAVLAPLLALASIAEHAGIDASSCVALAAIAWTISLLAHPLARPTTSPLVAMLPATIAGVLEPAAIALVPIAGTRIVKLVPRPPWAIAVPIAGGLAVMFAVIAGSADGGMFGALGARWFGPRGAATPLFHDALGPIAAVAALAGIAVVIKLRLAEVAILATVIGAVLVDLRAGAVGSTTLGVASLCAALAVARFAHTIRMPNLAAVAGATIALLLLVPPVWTIFERVR